MQFPGAVHALDPAQFDIAGGAATADPGERLTGHYGRLDARDRLRHTRNHLVRAHHAQMHIRHQAQCAPALIGRV